MGAQGVAQAPSEAPRDMRLTGIDLRVTSGTLELNRVTSGAAWLRADARAVVTEDIKLEANTTDNRKVLATSQEGIVTIAGDRVEGTGEIPDLATIQSYTENFATESAYGDVLLQGGAKPAEASIGTESFLRSQVIIWSQRFGCVVVPERFQQQAALPKGGDLAMTGEALSVDRGFREWRFYGNDEAPIRLEFKPASRATSEEKK